MALPTRWLLPYYRGSPLARQACAVYALLIVFVSLYPLSGWRDLGVSPFEFLFAPWPPYRTLFDLFSNLLAYIPLGFLLTLSLYPNLRGLAACLLATSLGLGLSCLLEIGQVYLPARVPSNLDTLLNCTGTLLGALAGAWQAPRLLVRSSLARWRRNWLQDEVSFGLILLTLWYGAQMRPQIYAFGLGDWVQSLLAGLPNWWPSNWPEVARIFNWHNWFILSRDNFVAFETLIVSCQLSAAGFLLLSLLRSAAPRRRLLLVAAVLAVLCKAVTQRILLGEAETWGWLTPGTVAGFLMSALLLAIASNRPTRSCLRLALLLLLCGLILTNFAPENLYAVARLETWSPGQWLNLHGVVRVLDWLWPVLAISYLVQRLDAG